MKWTKGIFGVCIAWLGTCSSYACSVCNVTTEEARWAYYGTTALLTLLPLAMIGGVVYYIAKKSR